MKPPSFPVALRNMGSFIYKYNRFLLVIHFILFYFILFYNTKNILYWGIAS